MRRYSPTNPLTHLQGGWCGATYHRDPTARATFGPYKDTDQRIYQRENC